MAVIGSYFILFLFSVADIIMFPEFIFSHSAIPSTNNTLAH